MIVRERPRIFHWKEQSHSRTLTVPYRTAEAKQHAKMEVTTKHMACRLKKNKAIALPTGHYKECFFNQLLHF